MKSSPWLSRIPRLPLAGVTCALVLGISALAAITVPYATVRQRLDALAGDGSADPYTSGLHTRLQIGAGVLGVALLALAGLIWNRRYELESLLLQIGADAAGLWRWLRHLNRRVAAPMVVLTLAAVIVRVPYLGQPMRFDESYTFNNYSSQPWFVAISKYDEPNNHVLHSLLELVTTRILGDAPWSVRLVAFVAGVLLVPATMLLGVALAGRRVSVIAGTIVACSSPLIEYSTNARGYTLICLCTVCGWLLLRRLVRHRDRAAWFLWGFVNVVGCWTIPIMIYPLAMQLTWLEFQCRRPASQRLYRGRLRYWYWSAVAATGTATLLAYLPVLLVSGPTALVGNAHVAPLSTEQFLGGLSHWISAVLALLLRDIPWPVRFVLLAGLLLPLARTNSTSRGPILGAVVMVMLLVGFQRVLPFPRVWLFLVPLAATLSAAGCVQLIRLLPGDSRRRLAFTALIGLVSIWPLTEIVSNHSVTASLETGTLPEAEQIIQDLRGILRQGEPVVTVSPSSAPLIYYARRAQLELQHFDRPGTPGTRSDCFVLVVNRRHPESSDGILRQLGLEAVFGGKPIRLIKEYSSAYLYRWSDDNRRDNQPTHDSLR